MAAKLNGQPLAGWFRFSSRDEYLQALDEQQEVFTARWLWGQNLGAVCGYSGAFLGFCAVCHKTSEFRFTAKPGQEVNLREEMTCAGCGLNARVRALLKLLKHAELTHDKPRVYLTEQTTLLYKYVKANWTTVFGSEWFGPGAKPRLSSYLRHLIGEREQLRHEDVTDLSFADEVLDTIVSCDVLEHVPDYQKALSEFSRVLVPGGRLLVTVPFMDGHKETLVRARLDKNGQIEHLEEPEYHGDPVDPKGVLAFYNFAWDLLERVREAGFSQAAWWLPWGPAEGLFTTLWILEAKK